MKEFVIEKNTRTNGSVWYLDLFPDEKETWLVNADGRNNEVRTPSRDTGEIVGAFGRNGRNAREFHWVHNLAIQSRGNISPPRWIRGSARKSCAAWGYGAAEAHSH